MGDAMRPISIIGPGGYTWGDIIFRSEKLHPLYAWLTLSYPHETGALHRSTLSSSTIFTKIRQEQLNRWNTPEID